MYERIVQNPKGDFSAKRNLLQNPKKRFIDPNNGKIQEKLVLDRGGFKDSNKFNSSWLRFLPLTAGSLPVESPSLPVGGNMAASISSLVASFTVEIKTLSFQQKKFSE